MTQGKKIPEATPREELQANVAASDAAGDADYESLVTGLRTLVKAWQRSDQLHDVLHEIAEGKRDAPIMSMAIRGEDGQPTKVEVDVATWSEEDRQALCELMINSASSLWLQQLHTLRERIDKVDDLYVRRP